MLECLLDCRLDRTRYTAESMVVLRLEMTAAPVLAIEPLQREGEQWQRILRAAGLDVGQQRIDQRVVDLERARRVIKPACRPLDDLGISPFWHRGKAERELFDAV
jgi:hypothetical protein